MPGPPFIRYQPSNYTRQELEEFTGNYFSEELNATYKIQLVGDKLVASHLRLGNIKFSPIMKDLFLGNHRYFNKIEYKRSNSGDIMGIRVSGYRTKNIWFQKKR